MTARRIVNNNWRECTKCETYKPRDQYYNYAKGTNFKKSRCIEYKRKRWYLLKSNITWYYKRQSGRKNWYKWYLKLHRV